MFKICFKIGSGSLDLGLQLNSGLVEARLFYTKGEEWLLYNRFDFICEEIDVDYNREVYNIPKYTSISELEEILKEIFSIYEDVKREVENELS